jgi:lysozyme
MRAILDIKSVIAKGLTLGLLCSSTIAMGGGNGDDYLKGIDVSKYQGDVDWKKVKQDGIAYCFIKASQGIKITDPKFDQNKDNASEAGIAWSAYHFFVTSRGGAEQAHHFLKSVGTKTWDAPLPPVVDIERFDGGSKEDLVRELKIFLETIELQWNVRPILYSGEHFYNANLKEDFKIYRVWIARYRSAEPDFKDWSFWQYSDKGKVAGIEGPVDMNHFRGKKSHLEYLAISHQLGSPKKLLKSKARKLLEEYEEKWGSENIDVKFDTERPNDRKCQGYLRISVLNAENASNPEYDAKLLAKKIFAKSKKKKRTCMIEVRFQTIEAGKVRESDAYVFTTAGY